MQIRLNLARVGGFAFLKNGIAQLPDQVLGRLALPLQMLGVRLLEHPRMIEQRGRFAQGVIRVKHTVQRQASADRPHPPYRPCRHALSVDRFNQGLRISPLSQRGAGGDF